MFPPFPRFEELDIRLNIDWGGRRRPIVTRLEQWPQSRYAVLVSHFADEPEYGEWVVMAMNRIPYFIGNPGRILGNRVVWSIATRHPILTPEWKEVRRTRLMSIIERAFQGDNFQIGRILEIPDGRGEPRRLLWCPDGASWSDDWSMRSTTPFEWLPAPLHLSHQQMLDMFDAKWDEEDSDMRFAWQWANWNEQERIQHSTGYNGDTGELSQLMRWVLVCMPPSQSESAWTWHLWGQRTGETEPYSLWNDSYYWDGENDEQDENFIKRWSEFLSAYFVPHWRSDWIKTHSCARKFWSFRPLQEVGLESSPTMHERLEVRLELRDWLQKNAPERTDLLGSL